MTSSSPTAYRPLSPARIERFRTISLACGVIVTAIGATALMGWVFDQPALRSVFAGDIYLKTNTAISLLLCGIALMLLTLRPVTGRRRTLAVALACVPIAIGLATLSEHLFGWNLGLDQLLFHEPVGVAATASPNRMGPPASTCFPLLGYALLRLARARDDGPAPSPAVPFVIMAFAAIPILGYAFGAYELFGIARFTGIALNTAIAFELLAIGILLARPETGTISLLVSDQPGGMMLRRMLPAALVIPLTLGLLRIQGERLGWYDLTFGRTILILSLTIAFSTLTWWSASAVSRQAAARVRAEASEQELQERLVSIVENVSQGFFSLDRNGSCSYVNPEGERLAGLPREEMIGRPLAQVLPAASSNLVAQAIQRAMSSSNVEHVEVFVPESRTWYEHDVVPTAAGVALFTRDVTESRTREEERRRLLDRERAARGAAEHSNRMKDEFLATLSHELRTPLNAILGWVHLMSAGDLTPEETRRGFDSITRNSRLQVKLIEDLLDMSRIVSGKVTLAPAPLDAVSVVEAALAAATPAITEKGLRVERAMPQSVAVVRADASRLQQVLSNLIANAVKFTPEGGRIRVSVTRIRGKVEIEVRDSGVGIAPEFLPHVFDRFRQADASTTRTHGGLGLGLAIARELTELHGGVLRVASDGPGAGAAFTVELPSPEVELHQPPGRTVMAPPQRSAAAPASLGSVRVLVVDDHADAREVLEYVLRDRGAEVVAVPTAERAIELIETRPFDILVSDIAMPGTDGHELIRAVRARQKVLPAIAVTAFARPEDRQRALATGYDLHLPKPIDPDRLVEAVANLVIGPGPSPER